MEAIGLPQLSIHTAKPRTTRTTRRKTDGAATAALLIQMASEILSASPTLRHRLDVTLTDLAAADKVRKELVRKSNVAH